jgi:CheY-like chemotaxis protein
MRPKRILVVDDNRDNATSLGMLIRMIGGHEVTIRYDGDAAVELLQSFHPEIVFLDIAMPNVDGYELCRRIRRTTWGDSVTVLAVTGLMHVEHAAAEAGFDGCILKPISVDQLRPLLDSPHSRRQAFGSELSHS